MGPVEDDCVRCPYHGWKYDASGKCVEIPANTADKVIPQRARVDSYPVEERYGLVWIFLGDLPANERPPIPEFPEFDDPVDGAGLPFHDPDALPVGWTPVALPDRGIPIGNLTSPLFGLSNSRGGGFGGPGGGGRGPGGGGSGGAGNRRIELQLTFSF